MNDLYLKISFILICILFSFWLYKTQFQKHTKIEHFSQSKPFVLKKNENCYDDIYSKHYDLLYKSKEHNDSIMEFIDNNYKINKRSMFLDIGCGSGNLLKRINTKTPFIFGIDKSQHMIEIARDQNPSCNFIKNDVLENPLHYDNNYFDIITCTNLTIYEIDNKVLLLRYIFNWLKRGGVFVLHLVEPEKFNMIVPISDYYNNVNELTDTRIEETELDFKDYKFNNKFIKQVDQIYIQKEEIIDKNTKNLRQYEKNLFFEQKNTILSVAQNIGFKILNQNNCKQSLGDEHQYFVMLIKPLSGEI